VRDSVARASKEKNTMSSLHQFLTENVIDNFKAMKSQQLLFQQRLTLNVTDSPTECMQSVLRSVVEEYGQHLPPTVSEAGASKLTKRTSVFQCFAAHKYYMGGHSVKAMYLDHSCPLTGNISRVCIFVDSSKMTCSRYVRVSLRLRVPPFLQNHRLQL
jgi:hypothetical protein